MSEKRKAKSEREEKPEETPDDKALREAAEREDSVELPDMSEELLAEVDKVIKHRSYLAMVAGLLPIPFLDFAIIAGIQLDMLNRLSRLYNVPFSKDMVKNLIGALIGGAAPASASQSLFAAMKAVPVLGTIGGMAGAAVIGGACTYAVGRVFSRHFAEGGTFLNFDPEKAREFYGRMFEKGRDVMEELKKKKPEKDTGSNKSA